MPTKKPVLKPYEGRDVLQASARVTNAGDGLSTALGIEPRELHHGDTVYLVLETKVSRVHYDEITDTDCLVRVHTLKAQVGTIVDEDLVKDVLTEQKVKNQKAADAAAGIEQLDLGDEGGE